MWIQVSVRIYAGRPSFYLLLTLGKIPESHWLSIVIQVRALNWQPQKLPKQWASQVEIDPSSLLNQTVSKSSVPSCYWYNLLFDPSAEWKKGRKKEKRKKDLQFWGIHFSLFSDDCFQFASSVSLNSGFIKYWSRASAHSTGQHAQKKQITVQV